MKAKAKWRRYRFEANEEDYRPVKFPPPGPYWCTGYGDNYSIVVAYLPAGISPAEYWPEAKNVDCTNEDKLQFTDRFPRPEWWTQPD